ncbi:hypothetical protein LEMLEM_LOCUS4459, partial [Lemmus lemmus]
MITLTTTTTREILVPCNVERGCFLFTERTPIRPDVYSNTEERFLFDIGQSSFSCRESQERCLKVRANMHNPPPGLAPGAGILCSFIA